MVEKLTVHREKKHDYLGMDVDWSKEEKVTISMIKYLHQILREFTEEIKIIRKPVSGFQWLHKTSIVSY